MKKTHSILKIKRGGAVLYDEETNPNQPPGKWPNAAFEEILHNINHLHTRNEKIL